MPHPGDKSTFLVSTEKGKFYEIELRHITTGNTLPRGSAWILISRYGKLGSAGRRREATYSRQYYASRKFAQRVTRMIKEGYRASAKPSDSKVPAKEKKPRDLYSNRFGNLE